MLGPLNRLFAAQLRRRAEDAEFAARLDASKTVFLEDLLRDVRDTARLARLGTPWLDAGRFTARIAAACVFLEGVARLDGVRSWEGIPLIFLQPSSEEDDAREHLRRCEEPCSPFAERFRHLPPHVLYLHVHTNVFMTLDGSWDEGGLGIRPLCGTFSTFRKPYAYDRAFVPRTVNGYVIGYRLTDYPWILGVSPAVATDFFARIVVHDLCHAYLPTTPSAAEGFHNAASLAAMGELPALAYRSPWERFVHAECTEPAFALRAAEEIAGVRTRLGIASLVQEDVLEGYRKWYAHPNAARKRREVWNLPEGSGPAELRNLIDEARADGFRLYVRLMKSS